MKILVVQLARLGDIYLSWPAVRALRRQNPSAEIHVLTRPRFAEAWKGLTAVHRLIELPTQEILAPLCQEKIEVQIAFDRLSGFVEQLHAEKYDRVLNLSFSPFSSYLTSAISHPHTAVNGYTRHSDGFLSIPDDMSAYFYAQVGVGRPNRFHLVEIFSSQVGMDLEPDDFREPHPFPAPQLNLPAEYIALHVGASTANKALSATKWIETIKELHRHNGSTVVLIGSPSEKVVGDEIAAAFSAGVLNCVGSTGLYDLFAVIKSSRLLVGCDSAPMHMATLTNTPCVNVSLSTVNFWETGPRSLGSIVFRSNTADELNTEKLALAIHRNLIGERQDISIVQSVAGTPSFWTLTSKAADFDWLLLRAIYLGEDFPSNTDPDFTQAIEQLSEINQLMMGQMEIVERTGDIARAAPFIQRGEEIIETIGKLVPAVQSVIRWYQTEKVRIGPNEMNKVLARTQEIHGLFQRILDLYKDSFRPQEKELE